MEFNYVFITPQTSNYRGLTRHPELVGLINTTIE